MPYTEGGVRVVLFLPFMLGSVYVCEIPVAAVFQFGNK